MFSFRSRRAAAVRRLWRLQAELAEEAGWGAADISQDEKKVVTAVLSRLKEPQVAGLVAAVESRGADPGPCCPVPALPRPGPAPIHALLCRLYRWGGGPEAALAGELVRLPSCDCDTSDDIYTCCNPYHWSRVLEPEPAPPSCRVAGLPAAALPGHSSPPPPSYASLDRDSDHVTEDLSSVATDGDSLRGPGEQESWCRLAYWEERTRVGRQLPVSAPAVEVLGHAPRPAPANPAMCLDSLHPLNPKPSQSTLRTREKIGLGVILSREGSGVWAHNRSAVPIFVNSPTLDVPNSRTFSVFRIPPGFSMQIFSWDLAAVYAGLRDPACYDGPFDPHSVRLSLGKGWGAGYGRQYVECCPCWLEVMLLPGR